MNSTFVRCGSKDKKSWGILAFKGKEKRSNIYEWHNKFSNKEWLCKGARRRAQHSNIFKKCVLKFILFYKKLFPTIHNK